jgi:outer membrane lipoprotein SlyB
LCLGVFVAIHSGLSGLRGIKMKKTIIFTMLLLLVVAISCSNMSGGEKGALTGAGIGAIGGAAITAIAGGNAAVGAAVGGAAGAVAGGIIGGQDDKKKDN